MLSMAQASSKNSHWPDGYVTVGEYSDLVSSVISRVNEAVFIMSPSQGSSMSLPTVKQKKARLSLKQKETSRRKKDRVI